MFRAKHLVLAAVISAFVAAQAFAQSAIVDLNGTMHAVRGSYPGMVAGSTLTRPNNTTAYTATSSAPQTICAATSVTLCAPGTIPISNVTSGRLLGNRFTLWKSGVATANASFIVWLYSAPPVMTTPNQFDTTSYTGPRTADMPNYLGNAACTTGTATSDTSPGVWYECTLSNPNTAGALDLQAAAGIQSIYYVMTVNAAYSSPVALEQFIPYMGGLY